MVGMREMRWKCGCGDQGEDAGNQGGNLSIVVEMTQNSNENKLIQRVERIQNNRK